MRQAKGVVRSLRFRTARYHLSRSQRAHCFPCRREPITSRDHCLPRFALPRLWSLPCRRTSKVKACCHAFLQQPKSGIDHRLPLKIRLRRPAISSASHDYLVVQEPIRAPEDLGHMTACALHCRSFGPADAFAVTGGFFPPSCGLPDLRSVPSGTNGKEFLHGCYIGGSHGWWIASAEPVVAR